MKKMFAYFNMIARYNLGPVMLILTLLAAVNAVVFHLILGPSAGELSSVLDSLGLYVVFADAFILLSVNLGGSLTDRGSHQNYFLARLRHRRMTLFWNQAGYNALCYVLLFSVEALSLLTMCMITVHRFPESYNAQSVMLACYQSHLLHTFLPLSDWLGWLTLGVMAFFLGVTTAAVPVRNRGGKASASCLFMTIFFLMYVFLQWRGSATTPDYKAVFMLFGAVTVFNAFAGMWLMGEDEDV